MKSALFITIRNRTVFKRVYRIETYEDEQISLTSSVQNINDISKVFTDYTQTFTVPASSNNNIIFKHWYENSFENGFDHRQNVSGYIEVDTMLYRTGKWRLEGANIVNGKPESYKITFFGVLKSLTDSFGDLKMNEIEGVNAIPFPYNFSNVKNIVSTDSDYNIYFPLISADKVWTYGDGGVSDIKENNVAKAIDYRDLFPAFRVSKLFEFIETQFNVNFSGDFLNDSRFTKAYLYFKNNEKIDLYSLPKRVDLGTISQNQGLVATFDFVNNEWNVPQKTSANFLKLNFTAPCKWIVKTYRNGLLLDTSQGQGTTTNAIFLGKDKGIFYATIEVNINVSYNGFVNVRARGLDTSGTTPATIESRANAVDTLTLSSLNIASLAPDMKITDFFKGILQMFNLTCYSEDGINFTLEQIEDWYNKGTVRDLSEYSDSSFDILKPIVYNAFNFEYQDSQSFMNKGFEDAFKRKYGNLKYLFNNNGSDYNIKLPFENLYFNKFTDSPLQVGYNLNEEFKPYVPKPIILYKYGNVAVTDGFYMTDGLTTTKITSYNVFGQDIPNNTLNWGLEVSTYLKEQVPNTLFNNYYLDYLRNVYELKSRIISIKMVLPISAIIGLKLNDKIIIRDKKYIINKYTTNLNTLETTFELIQDLRVITKFAGTLPIKSNGGIVILTLQNAPNYVLLEDEFGMVNSVLGVMDQLTIDTNENGRVFSKVAILQDSVTLDEIILTQEPL